MQNKLPKGRCGGKGIRSPREHGREAEAEPDCGKTKAGP